MSFGCISVAAVTASYGFALTASPFFKRRNAGPAKRNQKAFAPAYGTSLRLSVPSLRCPSGGIAYGLLRCTSSRCMRLRRTALRAYPLMNTSARPAEGAKTQKPEPEPEPEQKPDQEPLTLTLSQRERGLIEVFGRGTPTCDTVLNSSFEKHTNRPPLLGERAGVRGKPTTKPKPNRPRSSPLKTMSVSSSTAFDRRARRQAEWRD